MAQTVAEQSAWKRDWCRRNPEKVRAAKARHYQKYRERVKAENAAWAKSHPEQRAVSQWHVVGVVPKRPSVCDLCGKPPGKHALHLDHDHITGEFRGWLCHNCNTGIGKLRDDPVLLEKAALYLRVRRGLPLIT
jgi:hypothetical protein